MSGPSIVKNCVGDTAGLSVRVRSLPALPQGTDTGKPQTPPCTVLTSPSRPFSENSLRLTRVHGWGKLRRRWPTLSGLRRQHTAAESFGPAGLGFTLGWQFLDSVPRPPCWGCSSGPCLRLRCHITQQVSTVECLGPWLQGSEPLIGISRIKQNTTLRRIHCVWPVSPHGRLSSQLQIPGLSLFCF